MGDSCHQFWGHTNQELAPSITYTIGFTGASMNNSLNFKSVEGAVWLGLLLLGLASILLVANAIFPLATASMSEANASTFSDPFASSTVPLRAHTEPNLQLVPVFDHSVVNREGIPVEPEPSSPISPAYFHV